MFSMLAKKFLVISLLVLSVPCLGMENDRKDQHDQALPHQAPQSSSQNRASSGARSLKRRGSESDARKLTEDQEVQQAELRKLRAIAQTKIPLSLTLEDHVMTEARAQKFAS